jgi:hypothetical protein
MTPWTASSSPAPYQIELPVQSGLWPCRVLFPRSPRFAFDEMARIV